MRNEDGTFSLMNVPAYMARGFQKHDTGLPETVELLANMIYAQDDKITRAIVKPILRVSPKPLHRNPLIDMQDTEGWRAFVENIKFGLIVAATGRLDENADDEKMRIVIFMWAVQRGSMSVHLEHDPRIVCETLLGHLSVV
jgi:hypothetical protein